MDTEKPIPKKRGRAAKAPAKVNIKNEIKDEDEAEVMTGGVEYEYVSCSGSHLVFPVAYTDCHAGPELLGSAYSCPDRHLFDDS